LKGSYHQKDYQPAIHLCSRPPSVQFWEHGIISTRSSPSLLDGQRTLSEFHHVPHLFLRALRAIHSGDQSGQHIFFRLLSFPTFGDEPSSVNWCGEPLSFIRFRSHTRAPPHPASCGPRVANSNKKKKIRSLAPLRNNLFFSQDSTSSPLYFRLQRFEWTTALLPTSHTNCSWGPSAASLLVSPLTTPGRDRGVFAQIPSCLVGPSSYPTWRRILDTTAHDEQTKSEIVCPLILRSSGK